MRALSAAWEIITPSGSTGDRGDYGASVQLVSRLEKVKGMRTTRLSAFALSLAGLALAVPAHPSSGQTQTGEPACGQPRPLPAPSYDSFFGRQLSIVAESEDWRVQLAKAGPYTDCGYPFTFTVTNKGVGAVSRFRFCNETAQVDEIDLIKPSRALLLGRVTSGSPPVVTIVALPSGAVVDHFGCFLPALSPDRHYLAFVKDFPPHPGPVGISDEYIVYDLTGSAEYNHPRFKPGTEYDAGWAVYPPAATNAAQENILPNPALPAHNLSSRRLFWLEDYEFAFADSFRGSDRLVLVNLAGGIQNADVRTVDLDPSQLVDLGEHCEQATAPSDFEVWSHDPAGFIRVRQIDTLPRNEGAVCVYFVPSPCLRRADMMVKLP